MNKPKLRVVDTATESNSDLARLRARTAELRNYKSKLFEESFVWQPRELRIVGFTINLGMKRVPAIGTVMQRIYKS